MSNLGRLEPAFNWVLADRHGDIGYQMSGCMPVRRNGWNGLVPVAGWDSENDWQGLVAPEDLPRTRNPESGFLATANDDLNHLGKARSRSTCRWARTAPSASRRCSPLATTGRSPTSS